MTDGDRGGDATPAGAWDQAEMSFTEHLRELRGRLAIAVGTVATLAVLLFWPAQFAIRRLRDAYLPPSIVLNAFGPTDVIATEFKFSIYGAIVLGLPVLLYQLWMFVVPAVAPRTRSVVYAYVAPSIALAGLGLAFCHFFIVRRVVDALLAITQGVAQPVFGIEPTMNLLLLTFLAFALIFQTPVLMLALARIGLVNVTMLRRSRRYAMLGMLVVGAIAAPDGSPLTMLLLAVPMFVLYEIGIVAIVVLQRSWRSSPR